MSGGSQHNPNGRQPQIGAGWSPLQLQVASYLARAPQAHMASERGVTWHTPTPPHLYHVPAPSPPDPLQAMKASAASNALFRHTATPPDIFRHTPTPPDKHLRHTPSPGDVKAAIPPPELFPHLAPSRDKPAREEGAGGVDLSVGRALSLSVRDAPTINNLLARAPRRLDSLLERLAPAEPPSVIVHPEPKRKRKPEHTRRTSPPAETLADIAALLAAPAPSPPPPAPDPPPVVVSVDKLQSILASPEPPRAPSPELTVEHAAAPKRTRASNSESTNVPVESPSEAKAAEPECAEPTSASIVDVEDQLEKMFAGIEEKPNAPTPPQATDEPEPSQPETPKAKNRKIVTKAQKSVSRRISRASTGDETVKKKPGRKKPPNKQKKNNEPVKDAYDSGSNASSGKSRGPYIQIRGPRESPLSVSVMNACTGEEEEVGRRRGEGEYRNGAVRVRGLHASTLGLRYDASTRDESWLCAFCERGPHHAGSGDLFGPYSVTTEGEEFCKLEPSVRARWAAAATDVWLHADCAAWAPGVAAAGARVWGLGAALWAAAAARCVCGGGGAALACQRRACPQRAHLPCARRAGWSLDEDTFRAHCPRHAPDAST